MEKGNNYVFDFEKLSVYKLVLKFISNIFRIFQKLPRNIQFTIGEEFISAAISIANNIAEVSGKSSKYGKKTIL